MQPCVAAREVEVEFDRETLTALGIPSCSVGNIVLHRLSKIGSVGNPVLRTSMHRLSGIDHVASLEKRVVDLIKENTNVRQEQRRVQTILKSLSRHD
jgi:hypothetical protein